MGCFYPFAPAHERRGRAGPYATSFFFALGVGACALVANSLLMRYPLDGKPPVSITAYTVGPGFGMCGGFWAG